MSSSEHFPVNNKNPLAPQQPGDWDYEMSPDITIIQLIDQNLKFELIKESKILKVLQEVLQELPQEQEG